MGVSFSHRTTTMETTYVRRAYHAGSWYESSKEKLNERLTSYLDRVEDPPPSSSSSSSSSSSPAGGVLRGLVGPHAGFSYSGPTAAYAYAELTKALRERSSRAGTTTTILVLHPSHHVWLDGCAVSGASVIETPLGNLQVDTELRKELLQSTKLFSVMARETDEQEHSGELHYPFVVKSCIDAGLSSSSSSSFERIRILPIMVGALRDGKEESYGKLLAQHVANPRIITIVSSDFCHWGKRFQYQPTDGGGAKPIFEHISDLDHQGMNHIELQEPGAFVKYIRQTRNNVCGRHPISVWLNAIRHNKDNGVEKLNVRFVRYDQSSQVRSMRDSSVSYASAIATKAL